MLTSQNKDNRLEAVKGVWKLMRDAFHKMSLRQLKYVNLPDKKVDMARSMPVSPRPSAIGRVLSRSRTHHTTSVRPPYSAGPRQSNFRRRRVEDRSGWQAGVVLHQRHRRLRSHSSRSINSPLLSGILARTEKARITGQAKTRRPGPPLKRGLKSTVPISRWRMPTPWRMCESSGPKLLK